MLIVQTKYWNLECVGTKTKKMKFIGGGKVENKSCWKWFKLLFQFFLNLMKSEYEVVTAKIFDYD